MNLKDYDGKRPKKLEKADEQFLEKLNAAVKTATENFEIYEYSKAKMEVENFFWKIFTDNYLEIVKKRIYQGNGDEKKSAQYTLYNSLLTILKLVAPIMPFVTEDIYQEYFRKYEKEKSIHVSSWPKFGKEKTTEEFDLLLDVIAKVRQAKTKAKKPMNAEIVLTLEKKDVEKLKNVLEDMKNVACAVEIRLGKFGVEFV